MKEFFEKNKIFIAIIIAGLIIGGAIYFSQRPIERFIGGETWGFVGYQYRWSPNYVEHPGFKSELECVNYGNEWLKKQSSSEALFTCSLNQRPSDIPGIDTADLVCEYDRNGLIRCRE